MQPWISIILLSFGATILYYLRNRYAAFVSGILISLSVVLYASKYYLDSYSVSAYDAAAVERMAYSHFRSLWPSSKFELEFEPYNDIPARISSLGPCTGIIERNKYYELNAFQNLLVICENVAPNFLAMAGVQSQIRDLDRLSFYLFSGLTLWIPKTIPVGNYRIVFRSEDGLR